ncbi:class I SAM-dependent methyltransferase [Aureibaculum sp. 2210JD6-5]|uniref:class I SAM-dependent methyltransferase n=1 Tax=Aureibaculum sp. 2210JD6-5 TaxID=3103957 RepID=UPI002AAD5956|nr:class I SAM-dependent methyltransferase [Aureibaculum sp. 2210JD6-5]MDY7396054.1 class I SAM-dependent methyltransferase [Aureibaculum sp. 2210JD6-5]
MNSFNRKKHWETIYQTKNIDEVSWYQPKPETSLLFFEKYQIDKNANIIDIGGGDSFLVDNLLELGYQNITILDISEKAIEKVKNRLGNKANLVEWIVKDISSFYPAEKYEVWHDRAAFHFLTSENDISHYATIANKNIIKNGLLILGTFSEKGPEKCSGIEIRQYSEQELSNQFKTSFKNLECFAIDHQTPFDTTQNFVFCTFKKQ